MYIFLSLIPATFLVVVGYFVLFSSAKTEGAVKTFGQILAAARPEQRTRRGEPRLGSV